MFQPLIPQNEGNMDRIAGRIISQLQLEISKLLSVMNGSREKISKDVK